MSDEYCFSEKCQYRHWRSGSMPTHRKGDGCPKPHTPTTGEVEDDYAYNEWDTDAEEEVPRREAFRRWHSAELAAAWEAGYNACHEDHQRKTGPLLTPNPHRRGDDE